MHPALFVEDILRLVFLSRAFESPDLLALATTCRTFKDLALDVLWMELDDLSRLARCIPGAYHVKTGFNRQVYAFTRKLEETELNSIKNYTGRVRGLTVIRPGADSQYLRLLDPESIAYLCQASAMDPLFPNIHRLCFDVDNNHLPLLNHVATHNLEQLDFSLPLSVVSPCADFIHSLGPNSPCIKNIRMTSIRESPMILFSNVMNQHIQRWTHLRSMDCQYITLDIDTLSYLSHMPRLTDLSFTLDTALMDQIKSSNHIFAFSALKCMDLHVLSDIPVAMFLAFMRLPTIDKFSISQGVWQILVHPVLVFKHLLCLATPSLVSICIDLDGTVDLRDDDLLALAANCPALKSLDINPNFGWRSAGVTPAALAELLRRCPLLDSFSIALDTLGYVHQPLPLSNGSESTVPGLSEKLCFADFMDSIIEVESVPALAAFFEECQIQTGRTLDIQSWCSPLVQRGLEDEVIWDFQTRWLAVSKLARERVQQRLETRIDSTAEGEI